MIPRFSVFKRFVRMVLLCGASASVQAQVIQYFEPVSYHAVTRDNAVITFENAGYTQGPATGTMFPNGVTIGAVMFAGINGSVVEVIDGFNVGSPDNAVLTLTTATSGVDGLRLSFGTGGISAFATHIKGDSTVSGPFRFTLFSGAEELGSFSVATPSYNSFAFTGFSSHSSLITSLTVAGIGAIGGATPVLDNVDIGTFVLVPEPATLSLFILGACLLGVRRGRPE